MKLIIYRKKLLNINLYNLNILHY